MVNAASVRIKDPKTDADDEDKTNRQKRMRM